MIEQFLKGKKEDAEKKYQEILANKMAIRTAIYSFIAAIIGSALSIVLQYYLQSHQEKRQLVRPIEYKTIIIHDTVYLKRI